MILYVASENRPSKLPVLQEDKCFDAVNVFPFTTVLFPLYENVSHNSRDENWREQVSNMTANVEAAFKVFFGNLSS